MIFSTSTEYAIRGLAELASRRGERPVVMLDEIVRGTSLPRDFLAKLFQKLVHAGILRSCKGRGGGFALNKPAESITILDVCTVIDGPQSLDRCVVGLHKCDDTMPCAQHDLFKPNRQRLKEYFNSTTVADLAVALRVKRSWQKQLGAAPAADAPGVPIAAPAGAAAASSSSSSSSIVVERN